MELIHLLNSLERCEVFGDSSVEVKGISDDSRKVKRGFLFVAIKGLTVDAHNFVPNAINQGAAAVMGEVDYNPAWGKICYIKVPDTRFALSRLASTWYGNPGQKLKIIGVTGTKGKTTTTILIHAILSSAGLKAGAINSNYALVGKQRIDTGFHVTNPEPLALHSIFRKMVDAGIDYCVLEVTSHGLHQQRVSSIKFDTAVLTNVAHEHLDYHKNMQNYIKAKAMLFLNCNNAVLNLDDSEFEIFRKSSNKSNIITYSINKKTSDVLLISNYEKADVQRFSISAEGKQIQLNTPFLGDFNLPNILAAIAVCRIYKIPWKDIDSALSKFRGVEGRLEEIKNNMQIRIFVDFAHTPDSLEKILIYLKKKTSGKLICVFGCASERDTMKRPLMGKISTHLANVSIFTAEDPRREDVGSILSDIEKGVDKKNAKYLEVGDFTQEKEDNVYYKVLERGDAITFAIQKVAQKGDSVVICGKGHEKSMNYNGIEYPWSDKEAVELALRGKILRIKKL